MDALSAQVCVRRGPWTLDVSLTAASGEVVAVVGPNGAGKSTLLAALAGLARIDAGRIAFGSQLWDDPSAGVRLPPQQRRVGLVFQDHLLFDRLTALDNVAFGLRAAGWRRRPARAAAVRWLDQLGVADLAHRRAGRLSGGQAQRVALARALAAQPRLLLLDEPLAAWDAPARMALRSRLRGELVDARLPVVLVTHDPLEALVLGDRLVVLEDGRVTQQGRPAEVARRPRTDYVARLVGLNLYRGFFDESGRVRLDAGGELAVAGGASGDAPGGRVLVAVRPSSVAVFDAPPHGSFRNHWPGVVRAAEPVGDRVRLDVDAQPPVLADVTAAAVAELRLGPGSPVYVAVKATDVDVYPES